MTSQENKTVGLYIHIPFCVSKCRYCDFPSYPGMDELFDEYAKALCREMEKTREQYGVLSVDSIFFGGGTPSLLSMAQITEVINTLSDLFYIRKNTEMTIEVNPGTLTSDKTRTYRNLGFNRISIGLQAAQDHHLNRMGRIHTSQMFDECMDIVKNCGFHNVNADILLGIPSQTMEEWSETIQLVISKGAVHISCYGLKFEENTPWYGMVEKGELLPIDDQLEREMYYRAIHDLGREGYRHYEISNFAVAGYECRHNIKYWEGKPYLGFGAAAHSFFYDQRVQNVQNPMEYIHKIKTDFSPCESCIPIGQMEKLSERLILGLRMTDGVSLHQLENEFGYDALLPHREKIKCLVDKSLLLIEDEKIRLTKKGLDFANQVWIEFI